MDQVARVAFFPDTYDEIDGVANTSRQLEAFARKRGFPFLIVCAGAADGIVRDRSEGRDQTRHKIAHPWAGRMKTQHRAAQFCRERKLACGQVSLGNGAAWIGAGIPD